MITAESATSGLNRFLNYAISQTLTAFVIPGTEVARTYKLDLENGGFILTDTPRHANVLLLIGEIPENMRQRALVIYEQMPAPKALSAIGTTVFDPLPAPDVTADFSAQSIKQSAGKLRELFRKNAFEKNEAGSSNSKQPGKQGNDAQNGEGMDHGPEAMGFMSMVQLTENLPKSPDGLPMEWAEVQFGPLFAGLPGGLEATFLLDGDNVTQSGVSVDCVKRNLDSKWLGNVSNFLNTFSLIDPLLPQTYRILAEIALENALKKPADDNTKNQRNLLLEKERAISHLNWLVSFATLLHLPYVKDSAGRHLKKLQNAQTVKEYKLIQNEVARLSAGVANHWLLKKRLSGIGVIDKTDVWTRLLAVFSEIDQSLSLLSEREQEAQKEIGRLENVPCNFSGAGKSVIKTPRGKAELSIKLHNGKISAVSFTPASAQKIALIPELVQNLEVGDALVATASLNISPWEAAL